MPRFNGTGPLGQGSKTGRGLGKCNPANTDENVIYGVGRGGIPYGGGRGRMFGGGRRFNRQKFNEPSGVDDLSELKQMIRNLENKIIGLEKRETK